MTTCLHLHENKNFCTIHASALTFQCNRLYLQTELKAIACTLTKDDGFSRSPCSYQFEAAVRSYSSFIFMKFILTCHTHLQTRYLVYMQIWQKSILKLGHIVWEKSISNGAYSSCDRRDTRPGIINPCIWYSNDTGLPFSILERSISICIIKVYLYFHHKICQHRLSRGQRGNVTIESLSTVKMIGSHKTTQRRQSLPDVSY